MKILKLLIYGWVAGCGLMFVALQYHVVYSDNGLQLIPRTPQATLGLAWVDIRNWDAENWTDRPALVRAVIAHGASDLMSESAAVRVSDSVDTQTGTIGQLQSLLNNSRSSKFSAPLCEEQGDNDRSGSHQDNLAIPLFREMRPPEWDESLTGTPDNAAARSDMRIGPGHWQEKSSADPDPGFDEYEPVNVENRRAGDYRPTRDHFTEFNHHRRRDEFSEVQSLLPSGSSDPSKADVRVHETRSLEKLLFSEEDESEPVQALKDSGFEAVTRALDARALQALDRADSGFHDSSTEKRYRSGAIKSQSREQKRSRLPSDDGRGIAVPHSIRALNEGFDPFLN